MYGPIDFVWGSIYPRLYVTASNVRIWQMSHTLIWSLWRPFVYCTVDVRTYSQFQMICTYVLWDIWEVWLYACTETVRIGIEVTNIWCTFSILLVVIRNLYSWCTGVQPISNGMYICIVRYLETMAVRLYRNCTNHDWGHKCSMHYFNTFGGNLNSVQLMYGRTANLKLSLHMYGGIPWTMAVRLYKNCTNRVKGHKCSMHLFNPFGGNSDPVQSMYRRTGNYKYFELAMYGPIHFVLGSIYPWLYASTSTVRIWIDITNVSPTDLIHLAANFILYSWCTDVQPILNILN